MKKKNILAPDGFEPPTSSEFRYCATTAPRGSHEIYEKTFFYLWINFVRKTWCIFENCPV